MDKKIRICFMMTKCIKSGPVQQMLNTIKYMDREVFEPILLTINPEPEDENSMLHKYIEYVEHYYAFTSKTDIIIGKTNRIKEALKKIKPDIIYSLGVFPDYAISQMRKYKHVITLRNYVWDDYITKFGRIKGTILAKMHIYAMKHTDKTIACSESLSKIYYEMMGLKFDYIRNGVDVEQYTEVDEKTKRQIRKELKLPENTYIFVYSGQMIDRKNQRFLLETFVESFNDDKYLLLLGDGPEFASLKTEFGSRSNIDFRGNVKDVYRYLQACDAYVSTSKSEGMPNGVLEAMATGLPVVLSDIEQHKEVWIENEHIGYMYKQGDKGDLSSKMKELGLSDSKKMGREAYKTAHQKFSAKETTKQYQEAFKEIYEKI